MCFCGGGCKQWSTKCNKNSNDCIFPVVAGIVKVTDLVHLYCRKVPEMLSQMRLDEPILMWAIFRDVPEENTQSNITEKKVRGLSPFSEATTILIIYRDSDSKIISNLQETD